MTDVDSSTSHETRRGGPHGHPAVVRARASNVAALLLVVVFAVLGIAVLANAAGAAQLVQPAASPYHVTLDAGSHPQPFTIVVSGFTPDQQVFVEQCDGTSPSVPNWDPTIDCDSGSSPAPVVAGSDGKATFPAGDLNHRFLPFVGESPQSEFSCLAAGAPAGSTAGVPSFSACQVRVSSNNAAATADQVMFTIALPAGATPPPTTVPSGSSTTSTAPGGSTSTTRGATGKSTTTTSRVGKRATTTTIGSGLPAGAAKAAGGSSGSSGRSVAWLIAAIVVVAGIVGYGWAWRRKRSAARI